MTLTDVSGRPWRGKTTRGESVTRDIVFAALWKVAPGYMDRRLRRVAPKIAAQLDKVPLIFVHIPKTGGISISYALYGSGNVHYAWRKWKRLHPIKFHQYLKFAVVRHPIERFLSAYDFLREGGFHNGGVEFADAHLRRYSDINTFVAALGDDAALFKTVTERLHFRRQCEFVAAGRTLMVDRLIPFEEINDRVPEILGVSELPKLNVTQGKRTQPAGLSQDVRRFLERFYAEDIALYEFAKAHSTDKVFARTFSD